MFEFVRPYEEHIADTIKRAIGGALLVALSLPVANKQGFTIPYAFRLADSLGPYNRHMIGTAIEKLGDAKESLASSFLSAEQPAEALVADISETGQRC